MELWLSDEAIQEQIDIAKAALEVKREQEQQERDAILSHYQIFKTEKQWMVRAQGRFRWYPVGLYHSKELAEDGAIRHYFRAMAGIQT